jgi:uncharacterized membrane protein
LALWRLRHTSKNCRRSLVKAVTWRINGSVDAFIISFIITGWLALASCIAGIEIFTKVALYYFHERGWSVIPWSLHK